jgi:restriction system protein
MSSATHKVRTPLMPSYVEVNLLLPLLNGVRKSSVTALINAINDQMGTPQQPVDWSDPDSWIEQRLSGGEASLARRIWEETNHKVSPRYIRGAYYLINTYNLLSTDSAGIYQLTDEGQKFLRNDPGTIRELDDAEGLLQLLSILATKTKAMRGDLLGEWGEFLHQYSKFGTPTTIKDTLRRRLGNLVERGLILREGNSYTISPKGLDYISATSKTKNQPWREVLAAINHYNAVQRQALRDRMSKMHPSRFEGLVRDLLEAMGYENVKVVGQSGDKGVDVVATVQFGITTITEVVQVKRHQASIQRPTLDQLRGALHYHQAIRGTIITLGNFSKGCTEAALLVGAPPIGLINGDKLLDLLFEHEVGVTKRDVPLYELDESAFGERLDLPDEDGDAQI